MLFFLSSTDKISDYFVVSLSRIRFCVAFSVLFFQQHIFTHVKHDNKFHFILSDVRNNCRRFLLSRLKFRHFFPLRFLCLTTSLMASFFAHVETIMNGFLSHSREKCWLVLSQFERRNTFALMWLFALA